MSIGYPITYIYRNKYNVIAVELDNGIKYNLFIINDTNKSKVTGNDIKVYRGFITSNDLESFIYNLGQVKYNEVFEDVIKEFVNKINELHDDEII